MSALARALAHQSRGEHRQAVDALQAQLPSLTDEQDRIEALLALTRSLPRLGRLPEAMRTGTEALHLAELMDDLPRLCDVRAAMAAVYAHMEIGREAMEQALGALELARSLSDLPREGWALARVGTAYLALGDPVQARETTQQAREIAQAQGLVELEFSCLNNQAYFTVEEGEQLTREDPAGDADPRTVGDLLRRRVR